MRRYRKLCYAVSCGGITFGWLQAFEQVSFSEIFTTILTQILTVLMTVLFGGDASAYLA